MLAHKDERLAWLKSYEQADRHMNETGLHVARAEVMNWLDSLVTPNPLSAPQRRPRAAETPTQCSATD